MRGHTLLSIGAFSDTRPKGFEMCTAPNKLPDGTLVGCRECWQCRETRIDDWVGRCIAESKAASRTFSITLTYGRDEKGQVDHLRAALLTYSDVQKYIKRLRKSGYDVRYFGVGEYGSAKGRAHWHLILFFTGPVPDHEISTRAPNGDLREVRFSDQHWQHGWSLWEELLDGYDASAAGAVRYVCKYLVKDSEDEASQMLGPRMSKKPPLGDEWFRQRAAQYVKQGLAPQDLYYTFPDVFGKDGKRRRFRLAGVSADNFIRYYVEALTGAPMPPMPKAGDKHGRLHYEVALTRWIYKALSPEARMPNSELVEEWLDALIAPLTEAQKYREFMRDIIRKKYWDPAYGAGFNLYPKGAENV